MSKKISKSFKSSKQPITALKKEHNINSIEYQSTDYLSPSWKFPPAQWRQAYELIESFRSTHDAPVDHYGCSSLGHWGTLPPQESRYRTLIALMLSSQTKDETTFQTMLNLTTHGLTIENILQTSESTLDSLISKVGFHRRKATYIKQTTQILRTKYNDDVPRLPNEIMSLPGVGPKMAYLLCQEVWHDSYGIGVDVHVHTISNRLHWANSKTPEETRKQLEEWLPKEYWPTINKHFVGFGQTICKKRNPKCADCPVNQLCPSAFLFENASKNSRFKRVPLLKMDDDNEDREMEGYIQKDNCKDRNSAFIKVTKMEEQVEPTATRRSARIIALKQRI